MQAGGLYIPKDMALLPGPNQSRYPADSRTDDIEPKSFYAPDYVFFIEHTATGHTYVFDLGMRKDLENLPPLVKDVLPQFRCEPQSPADILRKYGSVTQQPEDVKAVIFSHIHFDHVGDGAQAGFKQAQMWIGPTCCTYARPGYPDDPRAHTLTDTLPTDGSRQIVEAYIPDDILKEAGDERAGKVTDARNKGLYMGTTLKEPDWIGLGAFDRAFDVYGDGSSYLIDAPGHCAGHQMMLVRTSSTLTSSTFVLLAGDCFHHPALLQDPQRTARPPYSNKSMHSDPELAIDTIWRTRKFAENGDVWVLGAHDFTVGEAIEKDSKVIEGLVEVNEWSKKGWKNSLSSSRW
jgi:glyoxylase-like metal-dependent hydrolase (beta-lactamase superfamily II)